jgi:NitT/TauT family transport system substrate-binding protein
MEQTSKGRRNFLSAAATLAAGATVLPRRARAASRTVKVRFAGQPFSAEMGRIVGKRLGYDHEFGVDWEFSTFHRANEISESLISGHADTGGIGSFASITMGAARASVKVAWAYTYGGNRTAVVARKGVDVKSPKDLIGKKVGSRIGGIDNTMLMIALNKSGVRADQVQIINMSAEDIGAGLASGLIDAGSGTEPSNSIWVAKGVGEVAFRGGKYLAAYAFGHLTDEFMRKEPEAAYATVLAYAKGCWWGRNNEAEAAKMMAEEYKQELKTVADSMYWLIYDPRLKPLAQESEVESAELLKSSGKIREIPDFQKYHYKAFIERAEREHPEYFADLEAYIERKEKQT